MSTDVKQNLTASVPFLNTARALMVRPSKVHTGDHEEYIRHEQERACLVPAWAQHDGRRYVERNSGNANRDKRLRSFPDEIDAPLASGNNVLLRCCRRGSVDITNLRRLR